LKGQYQVEGNWEKDGRTSDRRSWKDIGLAYKNVLPVWSKKKQGKKRKLNI
jgi:hypothetical protein